MTDIEKLIKLLEHAESFSLEAYGKSPNLSECSLNIQYLRACILQAIGNAKALRERLAQPDPLQRLTNVQQALEALEFFADTAICSADTKMAEEGIAALRAALAEQESVAGVVIREGLPTLLQDKHIKSTDQRLYTATQKREWQGLTDEEYNRLVMEHLGPRALTGGKMSVYDAFLLAIRATEAKLKEKNT